MAKRKFTPPTEFPAEYVDGNGRKVVLLGRAPVEDYPLIGYIFNAEDGSVCPDCWTEKGSIYAIEETSPSDLHDLPKRVSTWHNVYGDWIGPQCSSRSGADEMHHSVESALDPVRLCVYRIERDEDGSNPEIFVEEV